MKKQARPKLYVTPDSRIRGLADKDLKEVPGGGKNDNIPKSDNGDCNT